MGFENRSQRALRKRAIHCTLVASGKDRDKWGEQSNSAAGEPQQTGDGVGTDPHWNWGQGGDSGPRSLLLASLETLPYCPAEEHVADTTGMLQKSSKPQTGVASVSF